MFYTFYVNLKILRTSVYPIKILLLFRAYRDEDSKMATSRRAGLSNNDLDSGPPEAGRELFEACRNGDLNKVKKLVSAQNVNAKDTAGRKSSPLHFAAGLTSQSKSTDSDTD